MEYGSGFTVKGLVFGEPAGRVRSRRLRVVGYGRGP